MHRSRLSSLRPLTLIAACCLSAPAWAADCASDGNPVTVPAGTCTVPARATSVTIEAWGGGGGGGVMTGGGGGAYCKRSYTITPGTDLTVIVGTGGGGIGGGGLSAAPPAPAAQGKAAR